MVAGRDDVDALASTEKLSALEAKLLGDPSRMTVTIVTRDSVEKTYEEAGTLGSPRSPSAARVSSSGAIRA